MQKMKVPKFLHELFGEETSKFEFNFVLGFAFVATAVMMLTTHTEWSNLGVGRVILITLLMFDIYGGVVANLSYGTNEHYSHSNKQRLIFISIHVQPLILYVILGKYILPIIVIWLFTIISALFINYIRKHPSQRVIGLALSLTGLFILSQLSTGMPLFLISLLAMFVIKVIFSFPVDHFSRQS